MIKILFVSADPTYRIKFDKEFRCIKKLHRSSVNRDNFNLELSLASTYGDLKENLLDYKPSIIHFCCHGLGEEGINLVDNNGEVDLIRTDVLIDLFKICQDQNQNIICVVFNACHGEVQAKEVNNYIKYSIGMSHEIRDDYAIKFAEAFYQAIFSEVKIENAFALGCNSIRQEIDRINPDRTHIRAVYDPALDDTRISQYIYDYNIPQLFVTEDIVPQQSIIITEEQWNELYSILSTINFEIIKDVCIDTLRENVQDVESKILSLKNLLDLKKLLLEQYPIRKGTITIFDFAKRLIEKEEVDNNHTCQITYWLQEVADIDFTSKPDVRVPETIYNSYLLISIIKNTAISAISNTFSLEAELIPNYQEGVKNYQSITITSRKEGINEIVINENENLIREIEPYICELIATAIKQLPTHNLTIELFVPFDYLGEPFELCEIPSRRRTIMRPLGSRYRFTVHCLDRYEEKELFNEHEIRWIKIKEEIKQDKKCDYLKSIEKVKNWDTLSTKWKRDNFYAINIIDKLPKNNQEEYFDAFLSSGVPISLWLWNNCLNLEIIRVEEQFKELLNIEDFQDLSTIFDRIYRLREDACNEGDRAEEHLGYHLGFICDRLDPIPYNLKQRLNRRGLQGSN